MNRRNTYLASAAIALVIAAGAVVAVVSSGGGAGATMTSASIIPTSAHSTYGHPPRGLRIAYPATVSTVTASEHAPDPFALEGYAVHVVLPTGSADVQVEGPAVPLWVEQRTQAGTLKLTTAVPAVFTVVVNHVSGAVRLDARDWAVELATDQANVIKTTGIGRSITVTTGQTRTWRVKTMLPDGDGVIRWTPAGTRPIAAWSWQLEYD